MLGGSCQACALCVPVSQLCRAGPLHAGYPAWNTCFFRRLGVGGGGRTGAAGYDRDLIGTCPGLFISSDLHGNCVQSYLPCDKWGN